MLSELCEINHLLHEGQMGSKRQRNAIDAVGRVIGPVQTSWTKGKLTGMVLIYIKRAFHHITRKYLLCIRESMSADVDLMR